MKLSRRRNFVMRRLWQRWTLSWWQLMPGETEWERKSFIYPVLRGSRQINIGTPDMHIADLIVAKSVGKA